MLAAVVLVAVLPSAPVSARALSDVATLDGITVVGGVLSPEFSSDVRFYRVGVAHGEDRATVGFDKGHPGQAVAFEDGSGSGLADTDAGEAGHQVDLAYGTNTVRLVVTPADAGADAATYTLSIVRAVPAGEVGVSADQAPSGLDGWPAADNAVGVLQVSEVESLVAEGIPRASNYYSVGLSAMPSGDVTVSVSPLADGDLVLYTGLTTVSMSDTGAVLTLTFGSSNWNNPQFLTVSAVDDPDSVNDFVTLRHTASGGGYDNVSVDLEVEIVDTDATLWLAEALVTVPEGSQHEPFVRLGSAPSGDVTVSVSVPDGTGSDLVLVDDSQSVRVTGSGPVLDSKTFTSVNWLRSYFVTVFALDDDDDVDDVQTLRFTVLGDGHDFYTDVPVTVVDDESGILVFDSRSVSVTEGMHAEYGVKLGARPSAPVTVSVSVPDGTGSDLVLSTSTSTSVSVSGSGSVLVLTFGSADWNVSQSVRVHADADADTDDDFETLRHTVSGDGHDFYADVAVTVADNNKGTLVFSDAPVSVDEGSHAEYGVRLSEQPSSEVSVTVSADDDGLALVSGAVSSVLGAGTMLTLTFSRTDWNVSQSVTVHALEDDDLEDETRTLAHAASGGGYGGVSGNVTVTVTDGRHRHAGVR